MVVSVLFTLALASCGAGKTTTDAATPSPAGPPTVHRGNAAGRLVVPGGPVAPGSELRYGIANRGGAALTFGVCGSLERREGGGWSAVDSNTACIELAQILRPGERDPQCCSVTLPGDAPAREYRLVHEVSARGRSLRLQAAIDVGDAG